MRKLSLEFVAVLWFVLALLALCCSGCEPELARCPVDREQAAMQAAAYAWWVDGLPIGRDCDLTELHVQWTRTAAEFKDRCGVMPGPNAAACYLRDTVDGVYRQPLIVVAPGVELTEEGRPIVHETMHWWHDCNGLPADVGHQDVMVWENFGGAEAEAHRFMREVVQD